MLGAQPLRQLADDVVVGPALGERLEDRLVDLDRGVRAGLVDVGMLEEHGGRQDDVGHARRVGQELLVHGDEQVVAREAPVHLAEVGRDAHRVGVLDQQRVDRPAAGERVGLADQDRADPRLVEQADRRIAGVQALDQSSCPSGRGRPNCRAHRRPACCQAPVTTGRQEAACMAAAPLRERVKP